MRTQLVAALAEAERAQSKLRSMNETLGQQVQQRTAHLEIANKNLATFTYSAAHDVRTPLRAISGYAEILAEDYGDRLDEAGRSYAGRIQAAAGHMGALLDGLSQLSQVSQADIRRQDVDLSAEATTLCDQFRARDLGRRVPQRAGGRRPGQGERKVRRLIVTGIARSSASTSSLYSEPISVST